MDASRYLRLKKATYTQTLARNECISAGLRTSILATAATRTYVSPNDNKDTIHIMPCKTSKVAFGGSYVTPIMPPQGCPSAGACNDLNNRYDAPFITLPCCDFTRDSATYQSPCKVIPYQATPAQASKAEADYLCCRPNANMNTSG